MQNSDPWAFHTEQQQVLSVEIRYCTIVTRSRQGHLQTSNSLTDRPELLCGGIVHRGGAHGDGLAVEEELSSLAARQVRSGGHDHRAVGALGRSLLHGLQDGRAQGVAGLHEAVHVAGDLGAHAAWVHGVGSNPGSSRSQPGTNNEQPATKYGNKISSIGKCCHFVHNAIHATFLKKKKKKTFHKEVNEILPLLQLPGEENVCQL